MTSFKEGDLKFLLVLLLSLAAQAHQNVMTKIASLNEIEAYAPMVFHNQLLWLGHVDYSQRKNIYSVETRTPDGETVLSKQIVPHSVERLYPFDKERILVMGKAFTSVGWVTYYSLVGGCCGALIVETHPVSTAYQVEEFTGNPDNLFFNETGERSIVAQNSKGMQLLPIQVSGPGQMQLLGDFLWVLERRSFFLGDENIARINLKNMNVERVFPEPQNGLRNILALKDGSTIATAEYRNERLILVDSQDLTKQTIVPISGTHPRAIAEWGQCVIIASEYPHRLSIVKRSEANPQVIFEYDLKQYQTELPNLHKISVDPETGSVFLRSAVVPEESCTFNSVYRFSSSFWIAACEQ